MKTLTLSLSLPQSLQIDEHSAKELLVLALVESGRLSQSQGAQVLDMTRYELLELMGTYNIPVSRLSQSEHETERKSLSTLRKNTGFFR